MKKMKAIKVLVMVLGFVSTVLAGTGIVSGLTFDGTSDVSITDHTGESYFGYSVANAGDLNNDGYTDLVIGARGVGKAYVYYGGPTFDGTSDVSITDHTGGFFGCSVANAGDLNNDGYTDLVIGAYGAGRAYVYYGGPTFDGTSDVSITDHTSAGFAYSVANAGDLNNDGYTDLVIGAYGAGRAYVYYGGPTFDGLSDVSITDHTGATNFGFSVANAGDLNNDGYTDLVIGAYGSSLSYVYYGGPTFDSISDVTISGFLGGFGCSVANAGDLNNDGYTDLVIGAFGMASVYYGGPTFDGTSDVSITDHTGGYFGWSVANAGDLNNDGYTDLAIGAHVANKTFIYYGGPTFDGTSDVSITDHTGEEYFGCSVANAGDLNSDGCADLVIGAYGANKAFVYYYLPQLTIVTLQGKLTDSIGSPIQTASMRVTIKGLSGAQVWQNTFNDVLDDGVFNIPLGAVQELRLTPDFVYQMEIEIDADSATFSTADVTFGDGTPSGDVIKFNA